jgi:hypothetical protein
MRILLLLPLVAGCIGGDQTCVMDRLMYAGGADGQVLVKVVYTDAQGMAGQEIVSYPSVQLATLWSSGTRGGSCWGSRIERHQTANATAWIDAAARLPTGCNGVPFGDCAPQATDPQGQGTFAIQDFEQNYLDILIRDP